MDDMETEQNQFTGKPQKNSQNSSYFNGKIGENRAAAFLEQAGFIIIARNFRCKTGEIDIVALHDQILVFIEVKAWSTYSVENLEYGINKKKQKKIIETAKLFLADHGKYRESTVRFDVVFVHADNITHIKSAFTENS
ncbi:MAG: YraN family protein [Termitinemataceae bacterium]|nr:MAG: YraN family protein [Termitinemataceae bacterium]